jgi:ATP-dependent RNA helicase DeaD
VSNFPDLGIGPALCKALAEVGYETPSAIQAETIPTLLAGRDVVGLAQTGTGKTAAFALPILERLDVKQKAPQALVLAPTRELALQVCEAFQRYAAHLKGVHVLPVYGGQGYGVQLSALRRGVHVVVGTPGRIMDHLDKGTMDLSELKNLVLDEADEMLNMGFAEDVERILADTPDTKQVALFSATMPAAIRRLSTKYLHDAVEVNVKATTTTALNITQRYLIVSYPQKADALTRLLEVEDFDGMIVFVRTKNETETLAEKLRARGHSALAINGDVAQVQRERTVAQFKAAKLDILVATDVAARGLDVDRVSHVVNYDLPTDTESYVHRIGRTGRAGRSGEAILFVAPRERGMLGAIERATRQKIEPMQLPSVDAVNERRVAKFLGKIGDALQHGDRAVYRDLVERYEREHEVAMVDIAAALAQLVQGRTPLLLEAPPEPPRREHARREHDPRAGADRPARANAGEARFADDGPRAPRQHRDAPDVGMETFRIEVGHAHGVQPGNIVGAIANEADLESRFIGRIDIRDDFTLVDLPEGMPRELLEHLKKVRVAGRPLRMQRATEADSAAPRGRKLGGAGRSFAGGPRKPGGFKPGAGKPGFRKHDKPRS